MVAGCGNVRVCAGLRPLSRRDKIQTATYSQYIVVSKITAAKVHIAAVVNYN